MEVESGKALMQAWLDSEGEDDDLDLAWSGAPGAIATQEHEARDSYSVISLRQALPEVSPESGAKRKRSLGSSSAASLALSCGPTWNSSGSIWTGDAADQGEAPIKAAPRLPSSLKNGSTCHSRKGSSDSSSVGSTRRRVSFSAQPAAVMRISCAMDKSDGRSTGICDQQRHHRTYSPKTREEVMGFLEDDSEEEFAAMPPARDDKRRKASSDSDSTLFNGSMSEVRTCCEDRRLSDDSWLAQREDLCPEPGDISANTEAGSEVASGSDADAGKMRQWLDISHSSTDTVGAKTPTPFKKLFQAESSPPSSAHRSYAPKETGYASTFSRGSMHFRLSASPSMSCAPHHEFLEGQQLMGQAWLDDSQLGHIGADSPEGARLNASTLSTPANIMHGTSRLAFPDRRGSGGSDADVSELVSSPHSHGTMGAAKASTSKGSPIGQLCHNIISRISPRYAHGKRGGSPGATTRHTGLETNDTSINGCDDLMSSMESSGVVHDFLATADSEEEAAGGPGHSGRLSIGALSLDPVGEEGEDDLYDQDWEALTAAEQDTLTNAKEVRSVLMDTEDLHFRELSLSTQAKLLKNTEIITYRAGETVMHQGEDATAFGFLVGPSPQAMAEVVTKGEDGIEREVTQLAVGRYFGEKSLVYSAGCKRYSSVRALTDITTLRVSSEYFEVWSSFRLYLIMKKVPFLAKLPSAEQIKVQKALKFERYSPGSVIVRQNEMGDKFYMITKGAAEVTETTVLADGSHTVRFLANLYEGHVFGELALIYNEPRNADVTAISQVTCAYLTKEDFYEYLVDKTFYELMEERANKIALYREAKERQRQSVQLELEDFQSGVGRAGSIRFTSPTKSEPTPPLSVRRTVTKRKSFRKIHKLVERRLGTGSRIINKYEVVQEVGRGSFGAVYECQDIETKTIYAMKVIDRRRKRQHSKGKRLHESLRREVAAMKKLRHPNIVTLWEVIDDPKALKVYMIQEYMERGSILKEALEVEPLAEEVAREKFVQALNGLHFLHVHGIVHGDIKPANLLEGSDGTVKIGDFGACVMLHRGEGGDSDDENGSNDPEHESRGLVGTPAFMAPELFGPGAAALISPATDIWALGASLYQMVVGRVPWIASSHGALEIAIKTKALSFSRELDPHLKHLISRMLDKDPNDRMAMDEIVAHDWVTRQGLITVTQEDMELTSSDLKNAWTCYGGGGIPATPGAAPSLWDRTGSHASLPGSGSGSAYEIMSPCSVTSSDAPDKPFSFERGSWRPPSTPGQSRGIVAQRSTNTLVNISIPLSPLPRMIPPPSPGVSYTGSRRSLADQSRGPSPLKRFSTTDGYHGIASIKPGPRHTQSFTSGSPRAAAASPAEKAAKANFIDELHQRHNIPRGTIEKMVEKGHRHSLHHISEIREILITQGGKDEGQGSVSITSPSDAGSNSSEPGWSDASSRMSMLTGPELNSERKAVGAGRFSAPDAKEDLEPEAAMERSKNLVRKPDFLLVATEVSVDATGSTAKRGVMLQASRASFSLLRASGEGENGTRRSSMLPESARRNSHQSNGGFESPSKSDSSTGNFSSDEMMHRPSLDSSCSSTLKGGSVMSDIDRRASGSDNSMHTPILEGEETSDEESDDDDYGDLEETELEDVIDCLDEVIPDEFVPVVTDEELLPPSAEELGHYRMLRGASSYFVQARTFATQVNHALGIKYGCSSSQGTMNIMEDRTTAVADLLAASRSENHKHDHFFPEESYGNQSSKDVYKAGLDIPPSPQEPAPAPPALPSEPDEQELPNTSSSVQLAVRANHASAAFFGVYDGHGGVETVEALQTQLHTMAQESEQFPNDIPLALEESFKAVDLHCLHSDYARMTSSLTDSGRANTSPQALQCSGAVAVAVTFYRGPGEGEPLEAHIANVGDCRCILGRRGEAIEVTADHKPTRADEV
ncbi:unnamed protein product [Chrysoparadoxa australica]